jgi:hypothetical protein
LTTAELGRLLEGGFEVEEDELLEDAFLPQALKVRKNRATYGKCFVFILRLLYKN